MPIRRFDGGRWVEINQQAAQFGAGTPAPVIKVWRDGVFGEAWYPISAIKRWTGTAWVDVYNVSPFVPPPPPPPVPDPDTGITPPPPTPVPDGSAGTIAQQQALIDRTVASLNANRLRQQTLGRVYRTQAIAAEGEVPIPTGVGLGGAAAAAALRRYNRAVSIAEGSAGNSGRNLRNGIDQADRILRNPSDGTTTGFLRIVLPGSRGQRSSTSRNRTRWISARAALVSALSARGIG